MWEEDGSRKQRQGGGTQGHGPQQSRSYGHVAEAASWLCAPSPRVQSPPEVLAPSAARDLSEMQNRALSWQDESLIMLISHVVKTGFRKVRSIRNRDYLICFWAQREKLVVAFRVKTQTDSWSPLRNMKVCHKELLLLLQHQTCLLSWGQEPEASLLFQPGSQVPISCPHCLAMGRNHKSL